MKRVNFKKYVEGVNDIYIYMGSSCLIVDHEGLDVNLYRKVLSKTFKRKEKFFKNCTLATALYEKPCKAPDSELALLRYLFLEAYQEMLIRKEINHV